MKKERFFLYDMTSGEVMFDLGVITPLQAENYESNSLRAISYKQMLVEEALVVIQKDIRDGDLTAIEGLLQVIPEDCLIDFLPENFNT